MPVYYYGPKTTRGRQKEQNSYKNNALYIITICVVMRVVLLRLCTYNVVRQDALCITGMLRFIIIATEEVKVPLEITLGDEVQVSTVAGVGANAPVLLLLYLLLMLLLLLKSGTGMEWVRSHAHLRIVGGAPVSYIS